MPTQIETRARVQAILYSGLRGPIVNSADLAFLAALFNQHPAADSKLGCGIERIEIRLNRFNSPGFWIVRRDGSETDISYRVCISGARSHRSLVLSALRHAVVDQVMDFKASAMHAGARCALTGQPLDEKCHVDHTPPFIELAQEFAALHGGFDAVHIEPSADGMIGRGLADVVLRDQWCEFHRKRATLSLVTPEANIQKGAKQLSAHDAAALAIRLSKQFEFISGRWP